MTAHGALSLRQRLRLHAWWVALCVRLLLPHRPATARRSQ